MYQCTDMCQIRVLDTSTSRVLMIPITFVALKGQLERGQSKSLKLE